ncbi:MAG: DUF72 domain-containing protein, partial [Hyphomicrobiaceae bacterium]
DITAPFVYARLMGTSEKEAAGYPDKAIATWAERARQWAEGKNPDGLQLVGKTEKPKPRDVFLYVISGAKERNPAAAMALIDKLS